METNKKLKVCILSTMFLRYKNDTRGLSVYNIAKGLTKENIEVNNEFFSEDQIPRSIKDYYKKNNN